MNPRRRIRSWLWVIPALVGLTVIAASANLRLAALAGVAAGAVHGMRLRYSTLGALALLAGVACMSYR